MTHQIGVEVDCPFTVGILKKVTYVAAQSCSFVAAAEDLEMLAETPVTAKRIERWSKRVGDGRVNEVQEQAAAYRALPLPEQRQSPRDQVPQVACVMMDGGRIQVRDRHEESHDAKGYWKESLVGCCLSMTSGEYEDDPCPMIPQTFVDRERMGDLSREIKGFVGDRGEAEEAPPDAPDDRADRPEVLVKSVVATRQGVENFGERLIAEAHARGFNASPRKAFVADGAATNWGVHRRHFSHYTPIVDFTHAICYVYAAAMAGRSASTGWQDYLQWAQWLWQGSIDELVTAVSARAEQLGPPGEGNETSPAALVDKTLTYLKNQRSRMKYAEYRRLGLPITSSHIESTIKQINRRVKGSEKFWHQGAEPILQLAADYVSQTKALDRFWKHRPQHLRPYRCYQTAA